MVGIQDCPALEISFATSGRDILRRVSRRCALWSSGVRGKKGGPCGGGRAKTKKTNLLLAKCDQAKMK